MRHFLMVIVVLSVLLEAVCSPGVVRQSNSTDLPQHNVVGLRDGYVLLRTGQSIAFKKAIFTCNTTMIRLESEMVHQTILWTNVRRIYIENDFSIIDNNPDIFKQQPDKTPPPQTPKKSAGEDVRKDVEHTSEPDW